MIINIVVNFVLYNIHIVVFVGYVSCQWPLDTRQENGYAKQQLVASHHNTRLTYRVGQKTRTVFWQFVTPVYVDVE